jgi:hypothetical protein
MPEKNQPKDPEEKRGGPTPPEDSTEDSSAESSPESFDPPDWYLHNNPETD